MPSSTALLLLLLGSACQSSAFSPVSRVETRKHGIQNDMLTQMAAADDDAAETSRRSFFAQVGAASLAVTSSSLITSPAYASGGATAGGAYLLSAKQRYNERVKAGIQGFLKLESSLKDGSVTEAQAYFASEEVGGWGDISTAGYLLANAFRRNSSASPDSLPAVKVCKDYEVDSWLG